MAQKIHKKSTGPGRPKSTTPTIRLSPRLPENIVEQMNHAADLRGIKPNAFLIEAIEQYTKQVIEEQQVWKLRKEQATQISKLLTNPPKPTAFAKESARLTEQDVQIQS